jgi:NADPH-dependent 2,4-dienoyl-CoA reductase/sulfur reductase-like enzyme
MEAAMIASSRGHEVTLYEKQNELGGALRMASASPFKTDMKRFLEWMIRQTHQSSADVKLGTEAIVTSIQDEKPDVLIIAIGAGPHIPNIPGIHESHVIWAGDVDMGKVPTGKTVIVAGAGLTGCETALYLAQLGKDVMIIDLINESDIAKDTTLVSKMTLLEMLQEHGVVFRTEVNLAEITDKGVIVEVGDGDRTDIPADNVILSLGVRPRLEAVQAFQGLAREVYVVGDCSRPRNLMSAIHDAFTVAAEI